MPYKDKDKNRVYQREYQRRWYSENKQRHIGYVRKRDEGIQSWFNEYKKTLKCEECGENHPACLDFHHLNPVDKKFSVSSHHDRPSKQALIEEIAKCRVLCANCHRKEHWNERELKKLQKKNAV